ncbi:3-oxo-5-beta-steroid 4-dehydrogenase, partial [Stegodyphus mimosarum]
ERLKPIAEKYGKTPPQVLLRYLVQRGIVAIPKGSFPHKVQENIQIFDFSLTKEEFLKIKSMGNEKRRYITFNYIK